MKTFFAVVGLAVVLFSVVPAFGLEEVEIQDLLTDHGQKVLRTFMGAEVVAPTEIPDWTQFAGPVGAAVFNGGQMTGFLFFSPKDPEFLFVEFYDSELNLRAISWGLPGKVRMAIDLELGGKLSGVLAIAAPEPPAAPAPEETPKVSPVTTLHWSI